MYDFVSAVKNKSSAILYSSNGSNTYLYNTICPELITHS